MGRDQIVSLAAKALQTLFLPGRLLARRTKPKPRRILIVKPCCFGDLIMASAAISATAKAYPQTPIYLLVGEWSRPAVSSNPHLAGLIDAGGIGTKSIRENWREFLKMALELRRRGFDTALVLDRSPLLGVLCWLAGIKVRAGLDSDGRGFALTHPVNCPPDEPRHEVAWYLDVVRALGVRVDEKTRTEFSPSVQDRDSLQQKLAADGLAAANIALLHVGGGANPGMRMPAKRWAPSGWVAVLQHLLAAKPDWRVLLVGGASTEDRATAATILAGLGDYKDRVFDATGRFDWGELGALATQAKLYLGPDTGATHLAVASGAPVVAVFGPSDPRRYGPWDPDGKSVAVGGTFSTTLLAASAAALVNVSYHESVTPAEVWQAVERVAGGGTSRQ